MIARSVPPAAQPTLSRPAGNSCLGVGVPHILSRGYSWSCLGDPSGQDHGQDWVPSRQNQGVPSWTEKPKTLPSRRSTYAEGNKAEFCLIPIVSILIAKLRFHKHFMEKNYICSYVRRVYLFEVMKHSGSLCIFNVRHFDSLVLPIGSVYFNLKYIYANYKIYLVVISKLYYIVYCFIIKIIIA